MRSWGPRSKSEQIHDSRDEDQLSTWIQTLHHRVVPSNESSGTVGIPVEPHQQHDIAGRDGTHGGAVWAGVSRES